MSWQFWAKTQDTGAKRVVLTFPFKPVLHHGLDVAAAADCYLALRPALVARLAERLNTSQDLLRPVLVFLAALHDLGKISRSFQALQPDLWPQDLLGHLVPVPGRRHWRNSALLLRSAPVAPLISGLFPAFPPADPNTPDAYDTDALAPLVAAVAGHHGRPPKAETETNAGPHDAAGDPDLGPACVAAAADIARQIHTVLQPSPLVNVHRKAQLHGLSWSLAGLVTLADWVGSDSDDFPFLDPQMPAPDYWPLARTAAEAALARKGLCPGQACSTPGLSRVAPAAAAAPRPLQARADSLPLPPGPVLVILEDTTGAGKTEAGLTLAARMIAAGKAEGVFLALPTMATANAMYGRLAHVYRAFFCEDAEPSLVLAHGQSKLASRFQESIAPADARPQAPASDTTSAGAFCARWLADNRRKALLADVGAATIDQAFLAILRKKHLALRQIGLAGKVLLVDEAHCFDAYMGEELATLLHLHATLGGSAIILSATLSAAQKRRIAEAFARGLGKRDPDDHARDLASGDVPYPLITVVDDCGAREEAPGFDPRLARTVHLSRLASREEMMARALQAARKGAAVAIISNAVDTAIEMAEALQQQAAGTEAAPGQAGAPVAVDLFHARMTQADRQRIEADVLARFGKEASAQDRAGRILVATQVIEQSLDLDFDLVLSDLAPVDLLVQRAGRLWRHMELRPASSRPLPRPELLILSPDPADVQTAAWAQATLGPAAYTYQDPAVLWRSARDLFARPALVVPDDLRPLIESVYAAKEDDIPPPLLQARREARGQQLAARGLAGFNVIKVADGYGGLPDTLSDEEDIGTRLGEETVTVRLARVHGDDLVPYADGPHTDDASVAARSAGMAHDSTASGNAALVEAWALSELRCRRDWLGLLDAGDDPQRQRLKQSWPEWELSIVVAILREDGRLDVPGAPPRALFYDARTGLRRAARPG